MELTKEMVTAMIVGFIPGILIGATLVAVGMYYLKKFQEKELKK